MERSEIREETSRIKKLIKENQEKLAELQDQCPHVESKLAPLENETRIVKVCVDCEKQLGFPTDSELEESGYK